MKNLSVQKTILICTGIIAVLLLSLLLPVHQRMSQVRQELDNNQQVVEAMLALKEARFHVVQVQQFLTDAGATAEEEVFAEARESLNAAHSSLEQFITLVPASTTTARQLKDDIAQLHNFGVKMARAYIDQGRTEGNALMKRPGDGFDDRSLALAAHLESLVSEQQQLMVRTSFSSKAAIDSAGSVLWTLGSLCLLFVVLALGGIYLKVVPPLRLLSQSMRDIAEGEGDLTTRIPIIQNDELGETAANFNLFAKKVQEILNEVMGTSMRLTASSEQLAHASTQTVSGMGNLETDTEQVAQDISEIAHRVEEVAEHTQGAADASEQANDATEHGKSVVLTTIDSIAALATDMEHAVAVISRLDEESQSIGSILDTIRNISDQTNLLALNAAIEAARAGEAGRGFAVVADEVRVLAGRTSEATGEIQQTIERLQSGAKESVTAMKKGGELASNTAEQAQAAGTALDDIAAAVVTIREMNAQIATAARDQSTSAGLVNGNVESVANVAKFMLGDAQQSLSSSAQVNMMAEELRRLLSRFQLGAPTEAGDGQLIAWSDAFSVGITEIDNQHKRLIKIFNDLHEALQTHKSDVVTNHLIASLFEYTATHFGYEEKLLEEHGYPGFDAHKRKHIKLVTTLSELRGRYEQGDQAVIGELLTFLKEWLIGHIQGTDKEYTAFLNARGVS